MIAALAGGVGAARFLRGLVRAVDPRDVTVVVNVGDDIERHGLRVCPDLDTVTYRLAGVVDLQQQWGRADERFVVAAELARYGEDGWFRLGDRDLALHLHRTRRLRDGEPLSTIVADVARAWGLSVTLLPATDDPVTTRITTRDGRDLHFQEYWVGERAVPEATGVRLAGAQHAEPAPGVLAAIGAADAVLLCPSNPVVSIGTILAVPGIRDLLRDTAAPVVGVSPIVDGRVVGGMADKLLPAVGAEVSAHGVARLYADFLDGWVVDVRDAASAPAIARELQITVEVTDTMMDDLAVTTALARTTLDLAARLR